MIPERKIGEVFVDRGLKYQCVKGVDCKVCAFCVVPEDEGMICSGALSVTGYCSKLFRSDGEFVMFKLV